MTLHETALAPRDEFDALSRQVEPIFRAVNLPSGRKGLRLERGFWDHLAELARRRGLKPSELIGQVLGSAGAGEANAASLLRSWVADTQARELAAMAGRMSGGEVVQLLLKAPAPAFVVDRQKKLREVNPPFIQLVRATAEPGHRDLSADLIQLTLDVPVESLFSRLRQTTSEAQCGYVVQVDARQRRGRASILHVPASPVPLLVGYILS